MASRLQYEVLGGNLQSIRFVLQPGQVLIGEAGCMLFIDKGIGFECRMSDGSRMHQDDSWWGMFKQGFKRIISSESLFYTYFTNTDRVPRSMAVAAPMMGTMIPVDLHQLPQSTILAQSGAFLCAAQGVRFSIELVKNFGTGLFGGEGFILQSFVAEPQSSGQVFLHGGGTIVRKELKNEELTLEAGSLMAFTRGIDYDIGFPGFGNAFLGGSGLFLAKLRGTGSVWVQSTPCQKMIDLIVSKIPTKSNDD
eukprot:TRINITY_DN73275_c0_g1_i1.p1 TRINITY_DN73275_c0_g1~~TRINITY_DN73275_c0_g1_i1.p1  ORF type:complete len:251 (+),score=48.80 TRINITY_DN73275_c0_g1_i1:58-810(+)